MNFNLFSSFAIEPSVPAPPVAREWVANVQFTTAISSDYNANEPELAKWCFAEIALSLLHPAHKGQA